LDASRARKGDDHSVTLTFSRDGIERTIWNVSRVWSLLKDLDDLFIARINQTACDEPTVAAPATQAESKPALQASPPSDAGLALIRHIDVLGEAEDRLIGLMMIVDGIADCRQSSALSRTAGDIHTLVTQVRDELNALHEGAQHG